MNPILAVQLIEPGLIAASGTALLWFPARYRRRAESRHEARLAELEAGAEEVYFEEKRALQAYRPAPRDMTWQFLGALLVIIGAYRIFALLTE